MKKYKKQRRKQVYDFVRGWFNLLNVSTGNIWNVLSGKRNTIKGLVF